MISRRSLEAFTAILTGAFGLAVAISSLDNGIGWSSDGVDAGTFPFFTGTIIVLGSVYNLARGLLAGSGIVISAHDMRRLAALFVPAAIFVALIPPLGMYVASGAYVFAVVALPRYQPPLRALALALVTPAALYVVFERMFQVSLPHGALATALGM